MTWLSSLRWAAEGARSRQRAAEARNSVPVAPQHLSSSSQRLGRSQTGPGLPGLLSSYSWMPGKLC